MLTLNSDKRSKAASRMIMPSLLAAIFLGYVVRVYDLAAQSFWWDEAYSTLLAEQGVRAILREVRTFDFHPPLHYLLTWAWIHVAGDSEFALRYLALAMGCLTVAIGSRLGRRLYGERGGLVAAVGFALSPFLVYYSQEARMYAPAALLATLAGYLLHRSLDENRWRLWVLYALTCALGLYTFYYFVFVPIFGGAFLLLTCRRSRTRTVRWLGASLLTALLYVPWLPVLLGRNAVWDSQWAAPSSPLKTVGWAWPALTLGLPDLGLYAQPAPAALLGALGALVLIGLALNWRKGRSAYLFAALGFALPLALMAAIAMVKPVFHPRYAVVVAPPLLLTLVGAVAFPSRGRAARIVSAAGALVLVAAAAFGLSNLTTNPAYARDDYRDAVGHIESHLEPSDTIVYNADPGFRYYYHGSAPARFFPGAPYEEESIAESLNALASGKKRIWYLWHSEVPTDPEGFVEHQLDGHAQKLEETWFGKLRVTLYALPPTPSFATVAMAETSANFGGKLQLIGWGLSAPAVPSGGKVDLTLRWKVLKPDADYGVWVGLVDDQGRSWGRDDRQPRDGSLQLSSRWRPGEVVTTRHELPSLVGTPPGSYRLEVGVYRLDNVRGLDLLDAQGRPQGQSFSPSTVSVARATKYPATDPSLPSQVNAAVAPGVELAADKLDPTKTGTGGKLKVALLWRTVAPPGQDYSVDLRLTAGDGQTLAESKSPATGGVHPTSAWQAGELVREQRELTVPTSAPAGKATLEVALIGEGAAPKWQPLGTVEIDAVKRSFDEPAIPNRLDLDLGGQARLLGYRLEPAVGKPGGALKLTLYWRALVDGQRAYRVFTHLLDAESKIWGQKDAEPGNWARPTTGWLQNEVIEDVYDLEVQRDAPLGQYEVEIGMYDPQTGERLKVTDASGAEVGDRIILQKVEIR